MEYLLIDGYNIINTWRDIFDLDNDTLLENRNKFLRMLSNYQGYTNFRIVVVFDAHKVSESIGVLEKYDNIKVVYTKENQTADNFIERFVNSYRGTDVIRVATGDYLEQKTIFLKGGLRLSARELKEDMIKANADQSKGETNHKIFFTDHLTDEQKRILDNIRRSMKE